MLVRCLCSRSSSNAAAGPKSDTAVVKVYGVKSGIIQMRTIAGIWVMTTENISKPTSLSVRRDEDLLAALVKPEI